MSENIKTRKDCLVEIENILEKKHCSNLTKTFSIYDAFLVSQFDFQNYKQTENLFLQTINNSKNDFLVCVSSSDVNQETIVLREQEKLADLCVDDEYLVYRYRKYFWLSDEYSVFLEKGPSNFNSSLYLANREILTVGLKNLVNLLSIKSRLWFYGEEKLIAFDDWKLSITENTIEITMYNENENSLNKNIMFSLNLKIKNDFKDISTCVITGDPELMRLLDGNEIKFLNNFRIATEMFSGLNYWEGLSLNELKDQTVLSYEQSKKTVESHKKKQFVLPFRKQNLLKK